MYCVDPWFSHIREGRKKSRKSQGALKYQKIQVGGIKVKYKKRGFYIYQFWV